MDHIRKSLQQGSGNTKNTHTTNPRVLNMLESYDFNSNFKNKHVMQKFNSSSINNLSTLNNSMLYSPKRNNRNSRSFQVFDSNIERSRL